MLLFSTHQATSQAANVDLQKAFEQFSQQAKQDRAKLAASTSNLADKIETLVKAAKIAKPQLTAGQMARRRNADTPGQFVVAASSELRRSSQEINKQWDDILSKSKMKDFLLGNKNVLRRQTSNR
jgi:hypothetical protein